MRLIDADEIENKAVPMDSYDGFWSGTAVKLSVIRKSPTIDAVPVVRCRECKYRFKNNGHDKSGCPIIDTNIWMDDNDFCSHGEREEGAD